MTYTLSVKTNDVLGFRSFTYTHHGPRAYCGYLFAARHELHVYIEDGDFQTLAGADGSATLLKVSFAGRPGTATLSVPDFRDGPVYPFERKSVLHDVDVSVSGDAVLRRTGTAPVRYEVVVGMLRCAFAPMFEALRDGPNEPSALVSFWPSLPADAAHLDYVLTPHGLGLEGPLDLRMPARRDLLLLPRYLPGADDGDAAWDPIANETKVGTHTWERLDTAAPVPLKPNSAALVGALKADAPDSGAWPDAAPRWAMLRWRLMTPERQPFLDYCFGDTATGVRLERAGADPAAGQVAHAELVCQLRVEVDAAKARLEHGGMVCSVTGAALTAQIVWGRDERNSTLTASTARAGVWVAGTGIVAPGALFNIVHRTLRTRALASAGTPNLMLEWAAGEAPSGASVTLAPTGMLCGGAVAGAAGIDPPSERPAWLMLERGCLQLGTGAVPLDDEDRHDAAALLSAAADGSQVFRGGLPLAALGGPAGLTAWVSHGADGAEPETVLRIDDRVSLKLHDAILVWRTPGWWSCAAGREPAAAVPPVGTGFIEALATAPASRAEADGLLGNALGAVLFPALWVGRAGSAAAGGWPVDIHGGGFRFVVPPEAVRASVLWSAFHDAYLVQTLPAAGQALGGPLLDPARALVSLTHATGVALELLPAASGLPRLSAPPYASPVSLPDGWLPAGGELFHPNIAGLTLDPSLAHYTYRHGPPILADGYLRARLDGSMGGSAATVGLDAVRAADDVAIDAIALAGQPNESYRIKGWLAAPHEVAVTLAGLTLAGEDPQLAMVAAGGADSAERLAIRISSGQNGFDAPVAVAERGADAAPYLTGDTKRGKLLRNFGQSLAADDASRTLRDGRDQRWTLFAGGARSVKADGAANVRQLLTQRREGILDCGGLGISTLSLSLADVDIGSAAREGSWDLSGPLDGQAGSRPAIGPFAVHAHTLGTVGADTAEVSARLGAPVDGPGLAAGMFGGGLVLRWNMGAGGWALTLAEGGSFEWHFAAAPGADPSVASIGGALATKDGRVDVVVREVGLHTPLGKVMLPCVDAPIAYLVEDGVQTGLEVRVVAAAGSGLAAAFSLQYRFDADPAQRGWHILATTPHTADLKWDGAAGGWLTLKLQAGKAGAMRLADAGNRVRELRLAQAGERHWLALAAGDAGVEFAGCLEKAERDTAAGNGSTQLRLAYRWTEAYEDAGTLFGPLEEGSWVRVNGVASWQSSAWGGTPPVVERTLSAHLLLKNDYWFEFAQAQGAAVTMEDRVHCYVDALALDADGKVPAGVMHAMVEHRFHAGESKDPVFAFQVPQAIRLLAAAGGKPGMAANAVILLRGEGNARMPAVAPQVLYEGDETLGVCMGAAPGLDRVSGMVLRLPLRTGQGKALLHVPAARPPELAWFPVAPQVHPDLDGPGSVWQERRALATALMAETIGKLCGTHLPPAFGGGAVTPADGDTLPEWGALAQAAGWFHSGLLSEGIGVQPTLYYAGIAQGDAGRTAAAALPVTLYLPDAAEAGGLRPVARALVNDAAKVLEWGAGEMLRRSLRTSALVMAHGRPALSGPVLRRFEAGAVDDETPAAAPFADDREPPYSAWLGFLRPAEAPAAPPTVLTARTDQDAVLELVDAQPLVAGSGPALRFRLVLNHLVDEAGGEAPIAPAGGSLAKRVRLEAAKAGGQAPGFLPLLSLPAAPAGQLVSPPLVDVHTAVLRPGDTVYTRWALQGEDTDTGPAVEAALRCARASSTIGTGTVVLGIGVAASAEVDGIGWTLQNVTAARPLGKVPAPAAGNGIETVVVTPRDTLHRLLPVENDAGMAPRLTLGVAATQPDGEAEDAAAGRDLVFRLLEPLFCGAFPHAVAALLPAGSELAWAVAAGDGGRLAQAGLDPASVSSPEEIEASPRTLAAWNAGQRIRVVRLGEWRQLADRPGSQALVEDPAGYSLAPGAGLARLLRLTRTKAGATRHWLHREGLAAGPLLVLLIRSGTSLRYLVAHAVDWNRGAALEQPERVLAVRAGQVLGFGDLAGPAGIRLENGGFVLYKTAYALDLAMREDNTAPARAWLFGPDGACGAATP